MSMYECPKCGGVPGVTTCCTDDRRAQPAQAGQEQVKCYEVVQGVTQNVVRECEMPKGVHNALMRAVARSGKKVERPVQAGHFHQALTDPENQPNQYGVEFLMHGPKFAFKVGAQQFTLDYEPTEPGEFEFMRDMLIHAFTTFTPDVKTAQAGQVLADDEIAAALPHEPGDLDFVCARAIEQAVLAKRVPQWLPIETAPKDCGFLGYQPLTGGLWLTAPMYWAGSEFVILQFHHGNTEHSVSPTHWMPLPPPPGIVGEKGGA